MKPLRAELAIGPVLLCMLTTHSAIAGPPLPTPSVQSPLTVMSDEPVGPVTALALDAARYAQLRQVETVTLTGFPLDAATQVDLDLTRFEILSDDAQIIVHTATGAIEVPPPDLVLLRGTISGRPGSRVFLALTPRGANGYITTGDDRYIIAGAQPGDGCETVISHLEGLPDGAMGIASFICGTDTLPQLADRVRADAATGATLGECNFDVEIAIETDWEFTDFFEGDTDASGAYVLTLMGAVSEIYLTEELDNDVGIALTVSHMSLWECNDPDRCGYPWTQNFANDQLVEFQDYWNATHCTTCELPVERSTTHFLSMRQFPDAGGIAYLGVLCELPSAYGLSGHLNGSFPRAFLPDGPLCIEGHPGNWDLVVIAHELGHNFGAPHTHSVGIDFCAFGECNIDQDTGTVEGTIMSYCHLCKGGLVNINLNFHDIILDNFIHPYLGTDPCALALENIEILEQPASQSACEGDSVNFTVTATAAAGVTLMFQWRHNGFDILGATNPTYSIASVVGLDAGAYDVIVSGECSALLSDVAVLGVNGCECEIFSIVSHPMDQFVCLGDLAVFAVAADSNFLPLTFQWRKNGINIPGAIDPTLVIPSADASDQGGYNVAVSSQCSTVTSNVALLAVNGSPTCHPAGDDCATCLAIGEGTFNSTTADNTGAGDLTSCAFNDTVTEWLCYTATCEGNATASLCGSAYNTSLAVFSSCVAGNELACNDGFCGDQSQVTWPVVSGVTYYIRVSGVNGESGPYTVELSVQDIEILDQPLSQNACVGDPVDFTVTATANVPLTYQWRKNAVNIPGAINPLYSIASAGVGDEGAYDVIVSGTCVSIVSDIAILAVGGCLCENITIEVQPADQLVCPGDLAFFTVAATGNVPLSYQWRKDGIDIPGATGTTVLILSADLTDQGGYSVVVSGTCSALMSNVALLEIDKSPTCCTGCLAIGEGTLNSTTADNTESGDQTSCAVGDTITEWLCYTASCTGEATARVCGGGYTPAVAVFGSCVTDELACNAQFSNQLFCCCGNYSQVTWTVQSGTTYYVRVSGVNAASGSYTIELSCAEAPCPADLDGDGIVGITDFLALLAAWGTDPGGPPDFDGDGDVGITDFLSLLAVWGPC